jgi:hypothetical protein
MNSAAIKDVMGVILLIVACLIILGIICISAYLLVDQCIQWWKRKKMNHNRHNRTQ